jgi:hypothetical protein
MDYVALRAKHLFRNFSTVPCTALAALRAKPAWSLPVAAIDKLLEQEIYTFKFINDFAL